MYGVRSGIATARAEETVDSGAQMFFFGAHVCVRRADNFQVLGRQIITSNVNKLLSLKVLKLHANVIDDYDRGGKKMALMYNLYSYAILGVALVQVYFVYVERRYF